jgi:hypothetical protein
MSLLTGSGERLFHSNNWDYPPHNRSSFQHLQQLTSTARISRGSHGVKPLEQNLQNVLDLKYVGLLGESRDVGQMLDETFTDAFLVSKNTCLIAEDYRNGMGADSHHLLNSVSKSFVGMLVGILYAEGVIDPSHKLTAYLPEFSTTAFKDTTIRQALDMTAAVKFDENYDDRMTDFWQEAAVVGWRPELVNEDLPKSLFDYACGLLEQEQNDGAHFHYRTVLTNVIAMAIERATNRSVIGLIEEKIWQPLAPEQDAVVVVDPNGFPYFGAGMNTCARDLMRFGHMLLQGGRCNGRQIVPEKWIHDSQHGNDEVKALFAAGDYNGLIPGGHYRNQIWAQSELGLLICLGINGQTIFVNQSTGVVVVKFSTHPTAGDVALFSDTLTAMQAITESV